MEDLAFMETNYKKLISKQINYLKEMVDEMWNEADFQIENNLLVALDSNANRLKIYADELEKYVMVLTMIKIKKGE